MSFTHQHNLRLFARNEGKLKSYESCIDVRAWSHDVRARDLHLKEWMKADMPICILPGKTLAGFLRAMTCRSQRRATPRCHPNCKTNVLVESICTSCEAIRACLKQNDSFETYFVEEELETSHWPCDRCLKALKSITMFWKIIIDRILNCNRSKYEEFTAKCEPSDGIISVAKMWQTEITQQALFLKDFIPFGKTPGISKNRNTLQIHDEPLQKTKPTKDRGNDSISGIKRNVVEPRDSIVSSNKFRKSLSKSTSVIINNKVDVGCETCFAELENVEFRDFAKQIEYLQDKSYHQIEEMETLRKENLSLKIELDNVYKSCPWKASFYNIDDKNIIATQNTSSSIPKPFEANLEDNDFSSMKIDSEMIITMKDCRNESYNHISLLQVLHKTNEPELEDKPGYYNKIKDPMDILTKVQNTFGAFVKKEMTIVKEERRPKKYDNMDNIHRIRVSRSCSTMSSRNSSEQEFVSL